MARNFAGDGYVIAGIGGLVGIGSTGHSLWAICRRAADGAWHTPLSIETSANSSKLALQFSDTNKIQLIIGTSNKDTTVGITASDGWVLAGASRASGSSVPRGHKYVYSTDTWTHTDAAAASGGDSTDLTGGRAQIGRWQTTDFMNGDILEVGAAKRALSDAEWELLPFTLLAALGMVPDALWLLDQHATTQTVIDLSGNGANQTSLTNTSIATTSVPLWNYGIGASVGIGHASGGGPTEYTQTNTGSITPTGTLVRQPSKLLAGAVTPVGTVTRSSAKTAAGTLTPAGVVTKQTAKTPSGSLTPAGSVEKQTAKTVAGAIAPSGSLATLKAALRSFAGSITPAGAVTRQTDKALGGSITPAGTIQRSIAKLLAGAIVGVGAVAKQTAKRFTGALAPVGAVANTQPAAEAKATSVSIVSAGDTSTSTVTDGRTSTSAVTARATSSGGVT